MAYMIPAESTIALLKHARIRIFFRLFSALVLSGALAWVFAGCGGPAANSPGARSTHSHATDIPTCRLMEPPASLPDTVTIGLLEPVDFAHAPFPTNTSEQLVFTQLYETLSVEQPPCGSVEGGWLVQSTSAGAVGILQYRLREDARFWDGSPVTSRDVAACLRRAFDSSAVDSVVATDDRNLTVYLSHYSQEQASRWRWMSLIMRIEYLTPITRSSAGPIPMGSGPWRIRSEADVTSRVITMHPSSGADSPVLRFVLQQGGDARNLIERGVDGILTNDTSLIEYAQSRKTFRNFALATGRCYALLATSRVRALARGDSVGELSREQCQSLAKDAVHVNAVGAYLVNDMEASVGVQNAPLPAVADSPRQLAYDAADPTARELAERIVALSDSPVLNAVVPDIAGGGVPPRATGLAHDVFATRLHAGDDFAYIASALILSPFRYRWCSFYRAAPWLANGRSLVYPAVVPLVDTPMRLLLRPGSIGVILDGAGTVRIMTGERP
ncbi:MAG TPA: hypothetical protein VFH88_04005, partial [Candidatus Krumholzibacteria bacterium]|nr:hypothetical protein [Candidatus Krumholzibacteria bacterium]